MNKIIIYLLLSVCNTVDDKAAVVDSFTNAATPVVSIYNGAAQIQVIGSRVKLRTPNGKYLASITLSAKKKNQNTK